ncbi:MAG TPA: hypothetical protein VFQ87_14045 [Bradyrhizobium sp.]|jgi:hypothetical protein|nr:hypothetical protein [Bradyrhizobium sp.]
MLSGVSAAEDSPSEIIGFSGMNVSSPRSDETILFCDETIFRFLRRQPETTVRYHIASKRRLKAETLK